ncbi:2-oxo acid dehydrogenase subunit E2 [Halobellus ordinarius]|uniref:2-oxo acid dehydrogenase subunit E2 n=1 Tax=Halobellus ordinarius TaxID=3075120 RepID=UPI0028806AF1|nr:2-oxo acid dehydrogenase subunit E2 [Halobellus sp. ZY16]
MTSDEPAERTVASERSLSPMRRTIASRLQESYQEAVHVTVSREISAESMLAAADTELDVDGESVDPSVVDVLLCALSETLAEHPAFNATFEDGTHRIYEEHNVGVAVDIDDGLVTPVLEDVGSKSFAEISQERRQLTARVQAGEYSMSTFQGGTFTVSNLGPLGVDSFTPVINPPEVAILGVNRISETVVPEENSENGIGTEKRLTLDLSFDHRVVDGADAARFLGTLTERLTDAERYVE